MPVRFIVEPHAAVPVTMPKPLQKSQDCLDLTWGRKSKIACAELLQSSLQAPAHWPSTQAFDAPVLSASGLGDASPGQYLSSFPQQSSWDLSQLCARSNGFVGAVMEAYNKHHHLIIRPDDVWLAILSQFNLYVNANSEALRSYFLAHDGKKELVVEAVGSRYTVDFGSLARQMTNEIDKNVLDKELKDWILPDFTTTTHNDTVTSAVMMMSTLKAYCDLFLPNREVEQGATQIKSLVKHSEDAEPRRTLCMRIHQVAVIGVPKPRQDPRATARWILDTHRKFSSENSLVSIGLSLSIYIFLFVGAKREAETNET